MTQHIVTEMSNMKETLKDMEGREKNPHIHLSFPGTDDGKGEK